MGSIYLRIAELCARAPNFSELEMTEANANWLRPLVEGIPNDKCLEKLSLETSFASFKNILNANMTLRARQVDFCVMRGPLFDKPEEGE